MSERNRRGTWFIYPVNDEKTRGFAYRELRDDESKQLCLKACEVLPGEITLTREEFREAFAKACATPENANKQLDATLGFAIERMLFESEVSEK